MKVLLVYPNITDYPIDISTGLASISSFLKKNKQTIELLDLTFSKSFSRIKKIIKDFNPGIVGIPIASNDYDFTIKTASFIKKITKAPIVCGSYYATIYPENVLSEDCFDIAVIGEGERTFLEIINALENKKSLKEIKGIYYKNENKIYKNPLRSYAENICDFPFPDKEIFNYDKYLKYNRGLATFISSLGCPYECSYCINHIFMNKFGKKNYIRHKPVDYLINEIKSVISKHRVREIEFYDETFTFNKNRVKEFCSQYKEEIGLSFYINARVDTIDEEMLFYLKDAGCVRLSMGIETGDCNIRNNVLKRNQSDEKIINAFRLVKKTGLLSHSYNMIGIPFETKESIKKTIEINRICRPDFLAVSIFNAYPGTEIYEICKKNGWLKNEKGLSYFQTTNINHPDFSLKELKNIRDSFGYNVFKVSNYKRAVIDLVDKKMLKYKPYVYLRSNLIQWGIKNILFKK